MRKDRYNYFTVKNNYYIIKYDYNYCMRNVKLIDEIRNDPLNYNLYQNISYIFKRC